MALRNAFENLATESTVDSQLTESITTDRALLKAILVELKIINLHLALMNDQELDKEDLDMESN